MTDVCKSEIDRKYKKSDRKRIKKERELKENIFKKRLWAVKNAERYGKRVVAEILGVSVRTIYRWLKRYREHGKEGLKDKSRRPHRIHRKDKETVEKVIELRKRYNYGAEKIAIELGISPTTANRILIKAGLSERKKRKKIFRHYERKHSNSMWQMDYTMIYEDMWLFLAVDDHSRFIVAYKLMRTPNVRETMESLNEAFGKYGIPREILTDHGSQFYAVRGGMSSFDLFCLENEINHILASVRHPQTNGKVERKMGIVKEFLETLDYRERKLSKEEIKTKIEEWIEFHNYSRIHFAYRYNSFGDISVRKKVWFIPYLRFVCHRR
jgi:putative transposase